MGWFKQRFGEASTMNGLAMLAMVSSTIWPEYSTAILSVAAACGLGGVVMPEAKKTYNPEATGLPVTIASSDPRATPPSGK